MVDKTTQQPKTAQKKTAESGFAVKPVYRAENVAAELADRLGDPGEFPFTRGVYPAMYTERRWTMRQYAGYGSAVEPNARSPAPAGWTDRAVGSFRPAHPAGL